MYKISTPERPIRFFIPVVYSFVGLLLVMLIAIHYLAHLPYNLFTADPAASMDYNPFYGYISNIGILLWCATASVCFLSAAILNIRKDQGEIIRFLIYFGALTIVLMFDDLFMFHESIAPWYFHVPEKAVFLLYGAYVLFCLGRFHKVILTNNIRYLVLSMGAFGASVLLDMMSEHTYIPAEYFLEDGAKFIGIASWLVYFVDFSFNKIMVILAVSQIDIMRGRRSSKKTRDRQFMDRLIKGL